jgi:hypothetical protein
MLYRQIKHLVINRWLIIGLVMMLNLVGCTVSEPDARSSSDTVFATIAPVPSATPTVTPSATPAETITATPIPPSTPTPTFPVPTATTTSTPTPWPTLPPLPTIPPQQRGQAYSELINNNGGCELPCWWGVEMGKTSIEEVRQFYATFDTFMIEQAGDSGRSALYVTFVDPQIEDGTQVRHLFRVQDSVVIEAEAQVRRQPNYQIEPILHQFGQPAEIWIWTIPEVYEGILPASFRLYYPELGILVAYAVEGVKVDNDVQRYVLIERGVL